MIREVRSTFVIVIMMCSLKLKAGSRVRPRIFGFLMVVIRTSSMLRLSLTICSYVSDVKSVKEDLVAFSIRLLLWVQLY